jgi:hypothetical protein
MRRPKVATPIGLGEHGGIPLIRFHAPGARAIHRPVIRVRHDHGVAEAFQPLRHPLAFSPAFQQHAERRSCPKDRRQPLRGRRDACRQHDDALLIHNPNFTLSRMQIDGTILHGWLLLLRLERVSLGGAETLPRDAASRFISSSCLL